MRAPILLVALIVACGGRDAAPPPDSATRVATTTFVGPDPLFLRIPRLGGQARVVAFPNVDSTIWTSTQSSPAPGRVLGFNDDAGVIALVDSRSRPARIDFRRDSIDLPMREALTGAASLDGESIVGVTAKGAVVRTTPSDGDAAWRYAPSRPARGAIPLRDGSLLVWTNRDGKSVLGRIRPPSTAVTDSVVLPAVDEVAGTGVGDRLFFAAASAVYELQTKSLQTVAPVDVGGSITALAPTPSGDRIYALVAGGTGAALVGVDRYRGRLATRLPLDTKARGLRVDPVGRYLLIRGPADSVMVVAIATNTIVSTVHSDWREDLPLVAPDGSIATAQGRDVVFFGAEDRRMVARIQGGASDFWFGFWWTGFRPRAASLDAPVTFDSATRRADSVTTAAVATADTTRPAATAVDTSKTAAPTTPRGYTVSFFALLSEQRAQTEAAKIRVGDEVAHVETILRNGVPVYRVILGPYPTCAEAQRVGRDSGRTVWIPEGGCPIGPPSNEPLAR